MSTDADCVFCRIAAGKSPGSFIERDEHVMVFLDTQPVNTGHTLVVPVAHHVYLADLPPGIGGRMMEAAQRVSARLRAALPECEAINLFLADGAGAGQEVFHSHLHVLPRARGDGFGLRFGPEYGRLPPRSELDALAGRIRDAD